MWYSCSPFRRPVKTTTSSLLIIAIATAFIVVLMFYESLSTSSILQNTQTRFRQSSVRNYPIRSFPLPRSTRHTFTCEKSKAAVIDSFGTPCVYFTRLLREQNMYIYSSNNLSYVYCGIPKNGCTYHIAIMHRLMGYPYEGGRNVHHPNHKQRLRTAYANITQLLLSDRVPKYIVVRNPMHRILSAYLNKVETQYEHESQKTPESFHKWIYEEEALRPDMDWSERNPHWVPQVKFCGFKVRDFASYFRVFRVEEPVEYLEYLESFLPETVLKDGWNIPHNKSFRQHVLGPRSRTENTSARFFQYIGNLQTFDYLSEVYKEDIEVLGYREEVGELRGSLIEYLKENR